jgi:hypothetical protein
LQTALIALLGSVALNYAVAPSSLVGLPAFARVLASAVLIGTPVLFAAVCFSRLFERQVSTGPALGMNLIGAMAGGFAEYASMLLGMRAVWLLVLVVAVLVANTCLSSIDHGCRMVGEASSCS